MKEVLLVVGLFISFVALNLWGQSLGYENYQTQMVEESYVIVNEGCLELWKQDKGKHYEIGRLCPDSSAPQVVYRFEIFPQYITLIEE